MPTSWRSRVLLALAVLAVGVGLFLALRGPDSPASEPEVSESQTPEVALSETPSPEPAFPQPTPFRLEIRGASGTLLAGSNMYHRSAKAGARAARQAAKAAGGKLETYLNQMFVRRDTRFTAKPLTTFLTQDARRAVGRSDRRALGLGGPKILGGTTRSARARGMVLFEGKRAVSVTLRYTARMSIIQIKSPKPLVQSGTIVFNRAPGGPWRADLVDVRLSLPPAPRQQPGKGPAGKPTEDASAEATP